MSDVAEKTYNDFTLPSSVVSKVDLSRMVTEVERVDNEMTAAAVRSGNESQEVAVPVLSQQLTDFLGQNELKLDNGKLRADLISQLRILKDKVPVIHMTFAVTADPTSLQELAQWVRTNVEPKAVIAVGLQPALVAGVYLRTPNHIHDLSLRGILKGQHDVLVNELGALRGNR